MGDLDDRMDDIRAVTDAARFDDATVVGRSEGGAMAALLAATYPDRVERLVLVGERPAPPDDTMRQLATVVFTDIEARPSAPWSSATASGATSSTGTRRPAVPSCGSTGAAG